MKRLAYILMAAAVVFTACTKEAFEHPTEAGLRNASEFTPTVTVDQEINQVTFTLGEKGLVPVWVLQDNAGEWSSYNARDGFKKIFATAGDYAVRMYVMTASGISPDYVEKTFHINNTIVDFSRYVRYLAGKESKTWRIDNSVDAHQACGESVGNPTGWWAAKPDEKADFGIYDNRLIFTADGNYTFDPGVSGTVYVNTGVTASPYGEFRQDSDYTVAVNAETSPYEFAVEGNDLILKLKDGALFPYIPNNDYLKSSKFYVVSLDNNATTLVWYTATGNGGGPIAWQFILTSKEGEVKWNGFNYNADSNLWKPADAAHTYSQYYAPGWSQLPDVEVVQSGSSYTLNYPSATVDQWQAQFFIIPETPISLTSEKHYDFSVIVTASNPIPGMTFKLTDTGDDGNFLFTERVAIPAAEDYIFYLTDLAGIDADAVKMVFDFGGNADNTEVVIKNIVLKDHAVDDGTVLPDSPENPDNPDNPSQYTYGPDMLEGLFLQETWFSPAGWAGGLDPQASFEGGKLTLTVPAEIGGSEWMGQVKLVAPIPADTEKEYAFFATINASEDGVATVKVADANADAEHAFFYDNAVSLAALTPLAYKQEPVKPDQAYEAVMVIFDFGRMPAGTEITVTDIKLCEITGTAGGGGQEGGLIEGENLWATAAVEMTYWYSEAGWGGNLAPAEAEILAGNGLRVIMPEGIGGSEWMGQNAFHAATLPASKDEEYDFWMTLEADEDMTVTVKLAWNGHDVTNEFFYDNNVKLTAGKPLKYVQASISPDMGKEERNDYDGIVLFVDTGRSPAGSEVIMKDIHFQKHIGGTPDTPDTPDEDYTTNDSSIPASTFDIEGAGNLWRKATVTNTYWYSAADWSGLLEPIVFKADDWGGIKVIVPEGIGGSEWQGQTIFHTDIAASADATYDFCVTVKSDEDINGMTFKLAWEGNDNEHAMFYVNDARVKAGVPYQFRMKGVAPDVDYDKVVLFIDLGRCKVGTAVSFTDFCFQKSGGGSSGGGYGENLWGEPTIETWFSPSNWSGGLDPGAAYKDGKLTLTVPEGTGGTEWQGQVKLSVPVAVSASKEYDFSCRILADDDATITVKLADANADAEHAFFYDNAVALSASTPLTYKQSPTKPDQDYSATMLIFDFGRTPVGTEIEVSEIVLREIL